MVNRRVTSSLVTTARVKMYLGTYIFFKRGALSITDQRAREVDIIIKVKSTCPVRRYTGKLGMPLENILEKTSMRTIMVRSGLSMLQK